MPFASRRDSGVLPTGSVTSTEIADNTIVNADINSSAAIAATKIHDGSVDNTEYGFLNGVTSSIQTQIDGKQPLDSDLTALAAQAGTNTFPVRTGAGTISEKSYIVPTNFTPNWTLVGGSGNTVPVYTTNVGRWFQIGNRVFVDILSSGDGGTDGAGTGQMTLDLPVTAGASNVTARACSGRIVATATTSIVWFQISASATTASVFTGAVGGTSVTGADQSTPARVIQASFHYEV